MMTADEASRQGAEHRHDQATINSLVSRARRAEHQRDDLIEAIERALPHLFSISPMAKYARGILEAALGNLGRR